MTKSNSTKIQLEGIGPVTLGPSDYLATGGEGSIYRAGSRVIKLYTDPKGAEREGIRRKLELLKQLRHPSVVAPEGIVLGVSGAFLGYYMPVARGEPLPRVFTNDFRVREGFTDHDARSLVAKMRDVVLFAHQHNAVLVDPNEFNWIADIAGKDRPQPFAIDVDSWAIGPYQGKVIMPSIRDWHTNGFTSRSDWFAWAVVTFQIWTGIHPYKGKLAPYGLGELERRMKENASVFRPGARLNRAVRDFRVIPAPLLSWYEAVFEKKERGIPPSPFDIATVAKQAVVSRIIVGGGNTLSHDILWRAAGGGVVRIWPCGAFRTKDGTIHTLPNGDTLPGTFPSDIEVVRRGGGFLVVWCESKRVVSRFFGGGREGVEATLPLHAHGITRSGERVFAVAERGLVEIGFTQLSRPILSISRVWNTLPGAIAIHRDVVFLDALGSFYALLPFGESACATIRLKELDQERVIDAVGGERSLTVLTRTRLGVFERWTFALDRAYRSYSVTRELSELPELNVSALPSGVVATLVDDGEIKISVPTTSSTRLLSDQGITTDIRLARWEDRVVYIKDGAIWSMSMRGT